MPKQKHTCPNFKPGNIYYKQGHNKYCFFWFPGDRWTPPYCKHLDHGMSCPTSGLYKEEKLQ